MIHVELELANGEYGFEAKDAFGHQVKLDSSPDAGGKNFGIRPMQILLMGLGACSGIDIASILRKQRQPLEGFRISIDGERAKGTEATPWKHVILEFELKGNIDPEKARRACELSMDKYCSVAATLRNAGCRLDWKVNIINS
jgi:putative redox protein